MVAVNYVFCQPLHPILAFLWRKEQKEKPPFLTENSSSLKSLNLAKFPSAKMIKSDGETLRVTASVTWSQAGGSTQPCTLVLASSEAGSLSHHWLGRGGVFWSLVHFNKGRFGYSSRLFPQRTFPLGENTLQLTGPSGSPDLLLQFLLWGEVGGSRWLHCVLVAPSKQPWLLAAIPELQTSALVCFLQVLGSKPTWPASECLPVLTTVCLWVKPSLGWTSSQETLKPLLVLYVPF